MKLDQADKIFSLYIRKRDVWTCQRCLKKYSEGSRGLHCAHFFGRRNESVRFENDNAIALCYGCHNYFDETNRPSFEAFMRRRLGENNFNRLVVRANTYQKKDRKMSLLIAKELLKTLERNR